MKKKTSYKIAICFICMVLLLPLFYITPTKAKKVIRVAYPLQKGLTMKDEENNYYGYDYDYLMQIAQYTGWTYEFVEVEGTINERLLKLLTMLEEGEIDLLGGMRQSDALRKKYDYPSESYGNAYNIIVVDQESDIYDFNTLLDHRNLRIAVIESATARIDNLDQFAAMNGFSYEKILCANEAEMIEAIKQGAADAMLCVDLSKPDAYHSIARFSPDPFYFATTKGNNEIISELNLAMENIRTINPTLTTSLYARYFNQSSQTFQLTAQEQAYIDTHSPLQVLVREGLAPIQYLDNSQTKGVAKDILDAMAVESNLVFEYITATTYEEYLSILQKGEVDLVLGIPYEMSVADTLDISLSEPYISNSVVLVTRRGIDPANISTLSQGVTPYSDRHYDNNTDLVYFDSPTAILQAINDNQVDYTYLNQYLYTYYSNKSKYTNLVTFQTPDYLYSQYSYGVLNSEHSLTLLSILNKGIRSTKDDLVTYIYKNGLIEKEYSFSSFIRDNSLAINSFILGFILLLVVSIWYYYQHQLKMKKEIELEYQRYLELAEISGEMTFSYDYRHDELKISRYSLHRLANSSILTSFLQTPQSDALQNIATLLSQREDSSLELQLSLLDNQLKWYDVTLKIIQDMDKVTKPHAIYAIGKIQDIQEEYEDREILRKKSQTDALTGLLNRAGAEEAIPNKLSSEDRIGYLFMIDLDHFKEINDIYGHLDGDIVLKESAQVLQTVFKDALIARLGGDEFVVYCSVTQEQEIEGLCRNVLAMITQIPYVKKHNIPFSMSIGAVSSKECSDYATLLKYADESLYFVKRQGRNDFHIYNNKK